ncbi:hypothetical protein HYU14_04575 [Candidatus Woesearchaeota archaeon]|nr:hypothetical protein [Candidatus Woesearchaeota archaeon]
MAEKRGDFQPKGGWKRSLGLYFSLLILMVISSAFAAGTIFTGNATIHNFNNNATSVFNLTSAAVSLITNAPGHFKLSNFSHSSANFSKLISTSSLYLMRNLGPWSGGYENFASNFKQVPPLNSSGFIGEAYWTDDAIFPGNAVALAITNGTANTTNATFGVIFILSHTIGSNVTFYYIYNNATNNLSMTNSSLAGCPAHTAFTECLADKTNGCRWEDNRGSCEGFSGFHDVPPAQCNMLPKSACDGINSTICGWNFNAGTRGMCEPQLLFEPRIGFNCSHIINGTFCENQLFTERSGLCSFALNTCSKNVTKTFNDVLRPPVFSCDSPGYVSNKTRCENLSYGYFMPCGWNNKTTKCENSFMDFSSFQKFDDISSESTCQTAGGVWRSETAYNPISKAVSTESWCEFGVAVKKFSELGGGGGGGFGGPSGHLKDCAADCFSCEFNTTGGRWQNASAARSNCESSTQGCRWKNDTNAFNSFGWCEPTLGSFGGGFDCQKFCGDCNMQPSPQTACTTSNANCKWDNISSSCAGQAEKGCNQDCFQCDDSTVCAASKAKGESGCTWDSSSKICKPTSGKFEVCFDGVDNDNNGKTDCLDFKCNSDPFCGGSVGAESSCFQYDLFSYSGNINWARTNCSAATGCVWANDDLGIPSCMPASEQCFMNYSLSTNQADCESYGGGSVCKFKTDSVCVENDTMFAGCLGKNQIACGTTRGCAWNANFNVCDFAPVVICEDNETLQASQSACETAGCYWQGGDFGGGFEGGFFESCVSPCFNNSLNTAQKCGAANGSKFVGGSCVWQSGFCSPKNFMGGCFENEGNIDACNSNSNCKWFEAPVGPIKNPNGTSDQFTNRFIDQTWISIGLQFPRNSSGPKPNQSVYTLNKTTGAAYIQLLQANANASGAHKNISRIYCNAAVVAEYNYTANNCTVGTCNAYNSTLCAGANLHYFLNNVTRVIEALWEVDKSQFVLDTAVGNTNVTSTTNKSTIVINGNLSEQAPENASADDTTNATRSLTSHGFCNDGLMGTFFAGMDMEPPTIIAADTTGGTGDPVHGFLDIQGLGVKKTPQAYMYGLSTKNMSHSAICNGVPVGVDRVAGVGKNSSKYYLYLDTDGTATGGCSPYDNASLAGFEYLFKYAADWEAATGRLSETLLTNSCSGGSWVASSVPFKSDKTKGCDFAGGPIFAIDKDALNSKSDVNTSKPWRAYAATANSTGNTTVVMDTAGPGTIDFQGIDFELLDCTSPEDKDDSSCTKFQQFGFFPGEFGPACKDSKDNDGDGDVDCSDFDCTYDPFFCSGSFASKSDDKSPPKVVWSKVNNKVPTSLAVIYDTNEPSNGTVKFYNNDSSCSILNNTFLDKALLDSDTFDNFRPHHVTDVTGLAANVTYFYKLSTCDPSNNCGLSKCTNATTSTSHSNITFIIDAPDGWAIDIDAINLSNYSSSYALKASTEYLQNINITIKNLTSSAQVTFRGVNIFEKTTFNVSQFVTSSSLVGMDANQFQSLKQKTGAEEVSVKIPTTSTGTILQHCDDSGANCQAVTSKVNCTFSSTYTECTIPDAVGLGFSTYKSASSSSGSSSSSSSSSGGGGGGGAGGGASPRTKIVKLENNSLFNSGAAVDINGTQGTLFTFKVLNEDHKLNISKIFSDRVVAVLSSEPITAVFFPATEKKFDFNADSAPDLSVLLSAIIGGTAKFVIQKLTLDEPVQEAPAATVDDGEAVQQDGAAEQETQGALAEAQETKPAEEGGLKLLYVLIVVLIVLIISSTLLKKKKGEER